MNRFDSIAYDFGHASGVIVIAPREPPCGIRSQVEHEPWVLLGGSENVVKGPAALPHFFLPCHGEERYVVLLQFGISVEIIGPKEPAPELGPLQGSVVVEHQRLVHAPFAKARKPFLRRERSDLLAVFRAETRGGVQISVLEHDHPELPRRGDVVHLALRPQVDLLLDGVEVDIPDALERSSAEGIADAELVVFLGHPVRHVSAIACNTNSAIR